jgi:hypothetical protein
MKTGKARPQCPEIATRFYMYGGTRVRVLPTADRVQLIAVNRDHPKYGGEGGVCDHNGARIDGFNVAELTWEQIDQLIAWREAMRAWNAGE